MQGFVRWLGLIGLILTSGCAFISISLIPPPPSLKEQVIEGKGRPKILLIDISGLISEKDTGGMRTKPSLAVQVKESLDKAMKDSAIAGVILKVNSPGGTVTASEMIYHEVLNFKKDKKVPVYACIIGLGTSGGYYVASAADEVFAHPSAITGSIGVLALKFNIEGLLTKIGVQEETMKSVDKKDILSPFRPSTPEEKEIMQTILNKLHSQFVDAVFSQRKAKLGKKELEALADGRPYMAEQALEAKLIDRIGYLGEAIEVMKKSLGLKHARVVTYYQAGTYKNTIYSGQAGDVSPQVINLFNIDAGSLAPFQGVEFMYLWRGQ